MKTTTCCHDTHFYRPQRSCGQGNVFIGVCLSTGGRVSASVHAGMPEPPPIPRDQADPSPGPGRPPTRQTPRGLGRPPQTRQTPLDQADTPLDQADPQDQADPPPGSRLQHTVYERPVHILLECILVSIAVAITNGYWTHLQMGIRLFHEHTKLAIMALMPTLCSYIHSFLHYLYHEVLANVKLDINWCKRITFQGYRHHCYCYFLMAQPKQSWQYWHSYIVGRSWKTLLNSIDSIDCKCTSGSESSTSPGRKQVHTPNQTEQQIISLIKYWDHNRYVDH